MSWRDAAPDERLYGAQVFAVPTGERYSVRARVHIGLGNSQFHHCGEIGTAASREEAVRRWGTIHWNVAGLDVGDPTGEHYHLPRARIESHR